MSDKSNLEKFLQNFVAGEKDAAAEYLSQVIAAKTQRLVNEEKEKEEDDEDEKEKKEKEKKDADDKEHGESEKEMDKSKPAIKDGKVGDTKEEKPKKVDSKKGEGKQPSKKEE